MGTIMGRKLLIFGLFLIGITILLANDGVDDDIFLEQRAMDFDGSLIPFRSNLTLGEGCINSRECSSGCCLRKKRLGRRCAPKSLKKRRCTSAQVKGGMYNRFCPCESGDDFCIFSDKKKRFVCSK